MAVMTGRIGFVLVLSWLSTTQASPGITKVEIQVPQRKIEQFNSTPAVMRERVFNFESASFAIKGEEIQSAEVKLRGQSCVRAERPCLGLKLEEKVEISSELKGKKFNLVSMWQDEGYLNVRLGFLASQELGHSVPPQKYVEVIWAAQDTKLEQSMGIYLMVKKPDAFAKDLDGAEFVSRRRYDGFESEEYVDKATLSQVVYENSLAKLEQVFSKYQGRRLLSELKKRMNLDQYLEWLALNSLLQNGDFADELFYVGENRDGRPYFKFVPWDFEDLFSDRMHWIPFKTKSCSGFEHTPLYNCEVKFDRLLVQDPVVYSYLKSKFSRVVRKQITDRLIGRLFQQIEADLDPFFRAGLIEDSARLDGLETKTKEDWQQLVAKRKKQIQNRRVEILNLLNQDNQK